MNRFPTMLLVFAVVGAAAAGELPTDAPDAWRLRSGKPRRQTFRVFDYSPAVGRVTEVAVTPGVFAYFELDAVRPVELAATAEAFKGRFSVEVFVEPADAATAVSVRVADATGEVFQYRASCRPRPGTWITLDIPTDKPSSVWGGNRDKRIDYPVHFLAVTGDFRQEAPGDARMLLDNLHWIPAAPQGAPAGDAP